MRLILVGTVIALLLSTNAYAAKITSTASVKIFTSEQVATLDENGDMTSKDLKPAYIMQIADNGAKEYIFE